MGATSAVSGADALGIMLEKHPDDIETALTEWETRLRPAIADFQKAAYPMRRLFTQDTESEQRKQNFSIRVQQFIFKFPFLVKLMTKSKAIRLRNNDLMEGAL